MRPVITQYQEAAVFQPKKFNPVVIAESERLKVILACFEPGQFIPLHRPSVDLTLVVLEGEGILAAGKREERIGPGSVAFVPSGEDRGLKPETRMVALHVVSPPPTEVDHVDVAAKLNKGVWR